MIVLLSPRSTFFFPFLKYLLNTRGLGLTGVPPRTRPLLFHRHFSFPTLTCFSCRGQWLCALSPPNFFYPSYLTPCLLETVPLVPRSLISCPPKRTSPALSKPPVVTPFPLVPLWSRLALFAFLLATTECLSRVLSIFPVLFVCPRRFFIGTFAEARGLVFFPSQRRPLVLTMFLLFCIL